MSCINYKFRKRFKKNQIIIRCKVLLRLLYYFLIINFQDCKFKVHFFVNVSRWESKLKLHIITHAYTIYTPYIILTHTILTHTTFSYNVTIQLIKSTVTIWTAEQISRLSYCGLKLMITVNAYFYYYYNLLIYLRNY